MPLKKPRPKRVISQLMELNNGDCIHLLSDEDLFQVIGVDNKHKKCWVRRLPLLPQGSPVFEISMQQIAIPSKATEECRIGTYSK